VENCKKILACNLVEKYGRKLIGRIVDTEAVGEWPGGLAIVTSIGCKDDDNIVMFVRGYQCRCSIGYEMLGEIGVFANEQISLSKLRVFRPPPHLVEMADAIISMNKIVKKFYPKGFPECRISRSKRTKK